MSKKAKTDVANDSNNTQKVNKFKTSPLIIVISIIEVLVLIGAVTYAWFSIAGKDKIHGSLSVSPDSGLKIDFDKADESNFINIRNYLNDFTFEPATSVDGRNIFFPTTGTFDKTDTNNMKFREGTVNDVNSKYISIDFTLTNEGASSVDVFLNNDSSFNVTGGSDNNSDTETTGRAMRIAFYQNDNKSGKVSSDLLTSAEAASNTTQTVYFNDNLGWAEASGKTPYVYIWGNNNSEFAAWPGKPLTHVAGDQYYFQFNNDSNYTGVLFHDGTASSGTLATRKTVDLTLTAGNVYTPTTLSSGTGIYNCDSRAYSSLVSSTGYAVIAPGVSTGFQRPYAPVTAIITSTGKPTNIVSAFASSIDDYFNYVEGQSTGTLFSLGAHETKYMTMIMWLEGTDANCINDYYEGKNIDINLILSKSDDQKEDKIEFVLHDVTNETWLPDIKKVNGVPYNPVMQLYDLDLKRGYLMTPSNYNGVDGKALTWKVKAPYEFANHHYEFRRVNPMDESEVWNYWDAELIPSGKLSSVSAAVYSNNVKTQGALYRTNFTIFADGSPLKYKQNGTVVNYSATQKSCGGLWGDYSNNKSIITVYDASKSHYFDSNGGCLTMKYTYDSQSIEYKASATGNHCYIFIVPGNLLQYGDSLRPSVQFRRYYNFDDEFAINSLEKNPNITFDNEWNAGKAEGPYYQIGQYNDMYNDNLYKDYWGTDLLVVKADPKASGYNSDLSNTQIMAKFFKRNNETSYVDEQNATYVRLYNDDSFKGDGDNKAFACVVPCAKQYNWYRIETQDSGGNCKARTAYYNWYKRLNNYSSWYDESNGNTFWNYANTLSKETKISSSQRSDGKYNNTLTSGNIVQLKTYYKYFFVEAYDNIFSNDPYIQAWSDSGQMNWTQMIYLTNWGSGNSHKLFYYGIDTVAYSKIQIKVNKDGDKYSTGSGWSTNDIANGKVIKVTLENNELKYNADWSYSSETNTNKYFNSLDNTSFGIYKNPIWDFSNIHPSWHS